MSVVADEGALTKISGASSSIHLQVAGRSSQGCRNLLHCCTSRERLTGNGASDVNYDPHLPSNRLVFEVRKQRASFERFAQQLERHMEKYQLSEEERTAWRAVDIARLGELGVHPYFLPQISRLMRGSAHNDSRSEAAQLYRRTLVERK
jgi:hypothetical protein